MKFPFERDPPNFTRYFKGLPTKSRGSALHEFCTDQNLKKVPVNCLHMTESTQNTQSPLQHLGLYIYNDSCEVLREVKDDNGTDDVPAEYFVNHIILSSFASTSGQQAVYPPSFPSAIAFRTQCDGILGETTIVRLWHFGCGSAIEAPL